MITTSVPVHVVRRGNVGEGAGEYAEAKVQAALVVVHRPVADARIVLDWRHNRAATDPALAEVSVRIAGHAVRARSAAPTMLEAVDQLEYRLRRQLVQLRERARARQHWTGVAAEHEWRHADRPHTPASYFPRPDESREIVRRKSFASHPMTIDEAAFEMDILDHDFFLYRDLASNRPALVHRLADGGYGVQGAAPEHPTADVTAEAAPPTIAEESARERLDQGEPFVFFIDRATDEGRVLYRRYDGHYGLIGLTG